MTTGIGYYGNPQGNLPVNSINELEQLCKRTEIGTDVFVYGFNAGTDWDRNVINEVLENFLMAIHKNLLSVTVANRKLIVQHCQDILIHIMQRLKMHIGTIRY